MIHPFAQFSAMPAAGETVWDHAERLHKPAVEFAAYLHAGQRATPAAEVSAASLVAAPLRAASTPAGPATPMSPPRARDSDAAAATPATVGHPSPAADPPSDNSETPPATNPAGPPRFADVPDSAKYPAGPYRQAPAEYGGEWWLVNPFTGDEPWLSLHAAHASASPPVSRYATENLPEDFLQAFGEMPQRRAGENGVEFTGRVARWKQDLEFFQGTGLPEGFDESQVDLASAVYEQWGMGRPVFYEGRYGWFARFPDSAIPEFEMDAASAVQVSHLAVARYQVRLLRQGVEPATTHPFVPPHLLTQQS